MPHFYRADEKSVYSSRSPKKLAQRRFAIHELVLHWRALCEQPFVLDIEKRSFVSGGIEPIELDIYVLVHEENHLLEETFLKKNGVSLINVKANDPLMLPFGAQHVFLKHKDQYDWFVYSEDDLVPRDPFIFQKQILFRRHFGEARLLQPNRFEFNPNGPSIKTYIDGNLRENFIKPLLGKVEEHENRLVFDYGGQRIVLMRALNPHSGFFMLSQSQLEKWISSKTFLDMDCSFISPLESAATLGILKVFSLFKPGQTNLSFFEIEHFDRKFSEMKLPRIRDSH